MDVARDAAQVTRQNLADVLFQHLKGGGTVESGHKVIVAAGHHMPRPDRGTALRQSGDDRHVFAQKHARHPPAGERIRHLQLFMPHGGDPPRQPAAGDGSQVIDQGGDTAIAWIPVDKGKAGLAEGRATSGWRRPTPRPRFGWCA